MLMSPRRSYYYVISGRRLNMQSSLRVFFPLHIIALMSCNNKDAGRSCDVDKTVPWSCDTDKIVRLDRAMLMIVTSLRWDAGFATEVSIGNDSIITMLLIYLLCRLSMVISPRFYGKGERDFFFFIIIKLYCTPLWHASGSGLGTGRPMSKPLPSNIVRQGGIGYVKERERERERERRKKRREMLLVRIRE